MSADALYHALLCAAFWTALAGARAGLGGNDAARLVAGLALGAWFARAGGLLWVPAGLFLAAPLSRSRRSMFLGAALLALPLAFAVAKLGCLAASCCAAAGVEALGFAGVHTAVCRAPRRHAAALALAGIGLVRLAALPLRPEAQHSALLAIVWLGVAALRCRPSRGDERCPRPGNATSSRTHRSSRPGCAARSALPATSR